MPLTEAEGGTHSICSNFTPEKNFWMLYRNRHFKNMTRVSLILVYVSFFLVQLNVHFGKTPVNSFLTGDFVSLPSGKTIHSKTCANNHRDSKSISFRLNKRFGGSHLFTAPVILQDLVKYSFSIQVSLLNETQPLTTFSFNAPSLRGPPAVV